MCFILLDLEPFTYVFMALRTVYELARFLCMQLRSAFQDKVCIHQVPQLQSSTCFQHCEDVGARVSHGATKLEEVDFRPQWCTEGFWKKFTHSPS